MYYIQNKIIEKLANFVFPSNTYCISCGKFIDNSKEYSLCDYCRERINFGHLRIDRKKLENNLGIDIFLDTIWSSCYYGTLSRAILQSFKDDEKTYIARYIAEIMWERIATDEEKYILLDCDSIIPVPMSINSERSFNQTELMAKYLSPKMNIPVLDILSKSEKKEVQRRATRFERIINIRGTISIEPDYSESLRDKRIILLDDVFTTGATMNECAKVLKDNGAEAVNGLSFATGNKLAEGFFGINTSTIK